MGKWVGFRRQRQYRRAHVLWLHTRTRDLSTGSRQAAPRAIEVTVPGEGEEGIRTNHHALGQSPVMTDIRLEHSKDPQPGLQYIRFYSAS